MFKSSASNSASLDLGDTNRAPAPQPMPNNTATRKSRPNSAAAKLSPHSSHHTPSSSESTKPKPNFDSLPTSLITLILHQCTPCLHLITRLSRKWHDRVETLCKEEVERVKEQLDEAECWGHEGPRLSDFVEAIAGTRKASILADPLVFHRVLDQVWGPLTQSIRATALSAGASSVATAHAVEAGMSVVPNEKSGFAVGASLVSSVVGAGPGHIPIGPGATFKVGSGNKRNSLAVAVGAAEKHMHVQKSLFEAFEATLVHYVTNSTVSVFVSTSENAIVNGGGWILVRMLQTFIRRHKLHYVIHALTTDNPPSALSLLAAAPESLVSDVSNNPTKKTFETQLETVRNTAISIGEDELGSTILTSRRNSNIQPHNFHYHRGNRSTAPTSLFTTLTLSDIRPQPPKDVQWQTLNSGLMRLAASHGHSFNLPSLADLDPDVSAITLSLAAGDAVRFRQPATLICILGQAKLCAGAYWPTLQRALDTAVEEFEEGTPTSKQCALILLDAACNDTLGPRVWTENAKGEASLLWRTNVGKQRDIGKDTQNVSSIENDMVTLASAVLEKVDEVRDLYKLSWRPIPQAAVGCWEGGARARAAGEYRVLSEEKLVVGVVEGSQLV